TRDLHPLPEAAEGDRGEARGGPDHRSARDGPGDRARGARHRDQRRARRLGRHHRFGLRQLRPVAGPRHPAGPRVRSAVPELRRRDRGVLRDPDRVERAGLADLVAARRGAVDRPGHRPVAPARHRPRHRPGGHRRDGRRGVGAVGDHLADLDRRADRGRHLAGPEVRPEVAAPAGRGRGSRRVGSMTQTTSPAPRPAPREDGRADDELRPIRFTRPWVDPAAGSGLVAFGRAGVLGAASASEGVPRWRKGSGLGWVTAEYAMLPAATNTRSDRESVKGRIGGRTHEISRLIGRSLRAIVDYRALGENTIQIDCDVLQADGGTRTAAITGAYVALADAVAHLRGEGALTGEPLTGSVAAVSVGIIDGTPRLDLPYVEDVRAETDMNVVMTGDGKFVEVQGTAEGAAFDRAELDALLALAEKGCADLARLQHEALARA